MVSRSKTKLVFLFTFIFVSVVTSTLVVFVSYHNQKEQLQEKVIEETKSYIQSKTLYLKESIENYKNTLLGVRESQIFADYLQTRNATELELLFDYIVSSNKDVMQLRYIDKSGQELLRFQKNHLTNRSIKVGKEQLQNKKSRDYFQNTIKLFDNETWISKIDLNEEYGEVQKPLTPTLRIATPVYYNEKIHGIMIVNIFVSSLIEKLQNAPLFKVYLLEKSGDFLVGSVTDKESVKDVSWSKQLQKEYSLKDYIPTKAQKILDNETYHNEYIFSQHLGKSVGLSEDIILLLEVDQDIIASLERGIEETLMLSVSGALFIGALFGLLFSIIPANIATKILKSKNEFDYMRKLFQEYVEAMEYNNIISRSDLSGKIVYVNDNFCKVSGYTKEELIGKPHSILRDAETPKETFENLWLTIQANKVWKGIIKNRKKDGGFYYVDIVIIPIHDEEGHISEYLAIRHDITEIIVQRQHLVQITTKDALTGYGNRFKLIEDIEKHKLNNLAVIDIDVFSSINDFYGDKIGDYVLKEFATKLYNNLEKRYYLYRLQADKFAILNATDNKDKFLNIMMALNAKMSETIIETKIKSFELATTLGASSENNEDILATAEMTNKYAKKVKKSVLVYSKELGIEEEFEKNIFWTEKIKKALSEDRFELFYQPIYNNNTQKVEKYESLIRLRKVDGQIVSPFMFLDVAKTSNQYLDISKVVIRKSFEKFQNLDIEFSINLTIEDILDQDIQEYLLEMIAEYGVAHKLVLELVESEGIESFDKINKFLKQLKLLGCKIAIDDFGTGYSNFEYLIKINADYIKIDGSMIKNIVDDTNSQEIVKTIISFAQKMNFKTIAEYVSDEEVFEKVKELGIDYSQGFYIGKPEEELL